MSDGRWSKRGKVFQGWAKAAKALAGAAIIPGGSDDLLFTSPVVVWLVDVSVSLSPQVDGPVLIGTSVVPHSLIGTG